MNTSGRKIRRLTLLRTQAGYYIHRLRARLSTWLQLLRSPDLQNALHLYGDVAWFGIFNGIVGTFISVFAIRLGASDTLIGLLSALPALVTIFWQIPAARIVQSCRDMRSITVRTLLATRLIYLLIAIMPFFLVRYRAEAVVGLVTATVLPGAIAGVAFTTFFADAVPPDKRSQVVSVRNTLLSLVSMLSVLVAGKLLDTILFPYNYQIFFGVAFLASMASLYHVWKVKPLQERQVPPPRPRERVSVKERLRQTWQGVRAEREFFNFTLGNFIYNWGIYFPMALYSIYRVRELGASDTWIGLLSMVMSGVQTAMYLVWARVMKWRGNRWVFLVGVFGVAGFPLFTGLFTRVEPLLFVSLWGGIFGAAHSIAHFDCFMAAAPSDRLPTYLAAYNTLANITAFVGPLLGTTVAGWIGVRHALILGGCLRLVGAFILSRLPFGTPPPPLDLKAVIRGWSAYLRWRMRRKVGNTEVSEV